MTEEFHERTERPSRSLLTNSSVTMRTTLPLGKMTEPPLIRMEEASILESLGTLEDYSPSTQPLPINIPYITMTTTTLSNEEVTDEWRPSYTNCRLISGSSETSRSGSDDQSLLTWNGSESTLTHLDMSLFHSSPSWMNITSHTVPVTNTLYTPYTIDSEEESWLSGAILNYNPCGDETSMLIGFHRRREDEPGNLPDGSWDSTSLPSSAPTNPLEEPLTLTDTYLRCHQVNHKLVSQEEAAVAVIMVQCYMKDQC